MTHQIAETTLHARHAGSGRPQPTPAAHAKGRHRRSVLRLGHGIRGATSDT